MHVKSNKSTAFKGMEWVVTLIFSVISALSICLFLSANWMYDTWTDLSVDELIFHIKAPLDGTNMDLIYGWIIRCGIATIIVFIAAIILQKSQESRKGIAGSRIFLLALSACIVGSTLYQFDQKLQIREYIKNKGTYSTFIDDNYVDPEDVSITFPEKKRNLILIYLESMEIAYADETNGGIYEVNLIPELTKIAEDNICFSGKEDILNGATTMSGTEWTMGALFATASGLPLQLPISGNSMNTQDSFFQNLICLGDILKEAGYTQIFECGSNASFGGRRLFYECHNDFLIRDYLYYQATGGIPKDYSVWWGFEDDKLIKLAKQDLTELAQEDVPFNYTMLTVDTHAEDGYFCADCKKTHGDNQYANVISCSDQKVSELIAWIQEQSWYEDTTVILMGDHKTMDSDFWTEPSPGKTYAAYINADADIKDDIFREYTPFDHFPTILSALGVKIEGEKLGLGTNLFSGEQTLAEIYGLDYIEDELHKNSVFMETIAGDISYSKENGDVKDFVTRCYQLCLNRDPDENGLAYWCEQLSSGKKSAKEVIYDLTSTDEFIRNNVLDDIYIQNMYRVLIDRDVEDSELEDWIRKINKGTTRDEIFNELAGSDEFKTLCSKYNIEAGSDWRP